MNRKKLNRLNRRLFVGIIYIIGLSVTANADTLKLFEQLFTAKKAIYDDEYNTANTILTDIADECISCDNDTVKVVYYETIGSLLFFQGQFKECIPLLSHVPTLYEKHDIRNVNYLESLLSLGIANQKIGSLDEAEKFYRKGLLKSVFLNQPNKYRGNIYLNLGNLYLARNDSVLAKECFSKINLKSLGGLQDASLEGDKILDDRELQALNMIEVGQFEEAISTFDKEINYMKERIGTHNDDYVRNIFYKALIVGFDLGKPKDAIPLCEEVIALREFLPSCNENVIGAYEKLLQCLGNLGETEKISTILSEAEEYISDCPNNKERMALIYRLVGKDAYLKTHYNIAITFYEKYLALGVREEGDSYLQIPNMLAVAYIKTGEKGKAITLLNKLIHDHGAQLNNHKELKCLVLHNLGRATMLNGDKKKALSLLTESNEIFKSFKGEDNPKTIEYIRECLE